MQTEHLPSETHQDQSNLRSTKPCVTGSLGGLPARRTGTVGSKVFGAVTPPVTFRDPEKRFDTTFTLKDVSVYSSKILRTYSVSHVELSADKSLAILYIFFVERSPENYPTGSKKGYTGKEQQDSCCPPAAGKVFAVITKLFSNPINKLKTAKLRKARSNRGSSITAAESKRSLSLCSSVQPELESDESPEPEHALPVLKHHRQLLGEYHLLKVFGAFCSDPFRISKYFYATGETFLFRFDPDFQGGFALWLDADLCRGASFSFPTFHNAPLSTNEDFTVLDVDVWTVQD
ncbi:hypothetical protein CCH79_00007438 [Gambusia affinis]|uniref:TLDc domain-containing protein n=1 Tax=Gambusia affinis TaxID=33528 RepID=A0A315WBP2_GAMAF|nr:hypothetical protein CCH79_00007438 [Gambusia affinis]